MVLPHRGAFANRFGQRGCIPAEFSTLYQELENRPADYRCPRPHSTNVYRRPALALLVFASLLGRHCALRKSRDSAGVPSRPAM